MNLNKQQTKIIHSKPCGYSIIRGQEGCGKTTAAVYRMLYLKNQYCLYEDDRILMLTNDENRIKYIKDIYNKAEEETKLYYMSLFNNGKNKLDFNNFEGIILEYFLKFQKQQNREYEVILEHDKKIEIMLRCIEEGRNIYKRAKILNEKYAAFFIDEIKWMKSNKLLMLEQYQNVQRKGRKAKKGEGPSKLPKNSPTREVIFNLMLLYNTKLNHENLIDYEDMLLNAVQMAKSDNTNKYPHIIIDEGEKLTALQLEFIKELYNEKPYSNMTFVVDTDKGENIDSCLVKKGRLNIKILGEKVKRYSLKTKYNTSVEKCEENKKTSNSFRGYPMESFEYFDVRHNRNYEFMRDIGNTHEVLVGSEEDNVEYTFDELTELPVYNDIAAGMPILINPELEGNFYIPKYWLKGIKDCFILKVKGDSMINANIEDGDHVVIRKQYNAQHRDIVAVDLNGSATLKRLFIGKEEILLMPENEKYTPIPVNDEGVSIIGIVVGIIKNKIFAHK